MSSPFTNLSRKIEQEDSEEAEAREYVLTKELQRPKTTWITIAIILLCYILCCTFLTWIANQFRSSENPAIQILAGIVIWITVFLLIGRWFFIKLVECYQHYGNEGIRRRCLCKPTCSEYAIAVLQKYCFVLAMYKIWKRLFRTCQGSVYKIDPP